MMRGATLPPFPAGMHQPSIEVSVTIRFSLGALRRPTLASGSGRRYKFASIVVPGST